LSEESEHGFVSFVKSILRRKNNHTHDSELVQELNELLVESQEKGLISNDEYLMVSRVLGLKDIAAYSVMVPRTEIRAAPADTTLGDAIELINACGHTRIPIYQQTVDHIIGILHAKDILKLWGQDPNTMIPQEILRPPYFVPETQRISEILRNLKDKQMHMAIGTDEYGGTAGLITIEDIIEEIVGEIMDEHDQDEALLTPLDDHTVLVDARLEIEKLEEFLNRPLPRGDFESVGGFVISLIRKIPRVSEKIAFEDLEFTIKKANQRKIEKILITFRPPPSPPT